MICSIVEVKNGFFRDDRHVCIVMFLGVCLTGLVWSLIDVILTDL